MSSPASIAKHPIHPMLVAVPIGLWIFSFVCDLISLAGWGGPVWGDLAFYSMAAGLVGALLAAVPGLIDLISLSDPRVKTIGIWHMVINLIVVALFAFNLWLRTRNVPGSKLPVGLSVVAIILLGIPAYYMFRSGGSRKS